MLRTDLAVEEHDRLIGKKKEVQGVGVEIETKDTGIVIEKLRVDTQNAAKEMGKPKGEYITIEFSKVKTKDDICKKYVAEELANQIRLLLPKEISKDRFTVGRCGEENFSALIVGLGNRGVQMDALGPMTIDKIQMSRYFMKQFGKYAYASAELSHISGIAPGVMEQTGLETCEVVKGIVGEIEPDVVITIDALVGKNVRRLGRTIQITSSGVIPGSGVGVCHKKLSKETLGVPVISIGVPTVVDAGSGLFLISKKLPSMMERVSDIIALGIEHALHGI